MIKKVERAMKKLEIDRGGSLLFWLIKQGGGGHDKIYLHVK
jgi:hypothetical protein